MKNNKKLAIEQLDKKVKPYSKLKIVTPPYFGWINYIRTSLNITLEQLGNKLGYSKQAVKKMEEREQNGAITLKSLKKIAHALDVHFVYGFVPKNSFQDLVDKKIEALAKKIVMRTNQNMVLEDQGTSEYRLKKAIKETSQDLKNEMPKSLWD